MNYIYAIASPKPNFLAIVDNAFGNEVFRIDGNKIFDEKIMSNTKDIAGLQKYLIQTGIMYEGDVLKDFDEMKKYDEKVEKKRGHFFETGGETTSENFCSEYDLEMLSVLKKYSPPFGYELKEKCYVLPPDNKMKYFCADIRVASDIITTLQSDSMAFDQLLNHFKEFGIKNGLKLPYIYNIQNNPDKSTITFQIIELT